MRLFTIAGVMALFMLSLPFQQNFARERGGDTADKKDALEGKAPPALRAQAWLNVGEKPPTWASLKGKVVLLEFWAHW